jgi:ADP-dependent phosphofructokinase/glucokinase
MLNTVKIPLLTAIDYISRGVDAELKRRIKDELMKHAESVVEEVAVAMAAGLKAQLKSYSNDMNKEFVVELSLNGVKATKLESNADCRNAQQALGFRPKQDWKI